MSLHRHVGIEMVKCSVSLFTTIVPTLVHTLDFFVAATGPFVLLSTRNGNEGINLIAEGQVINATQSQGARFLTCPGRGGPVVAGDPAGGAPGEL